MKLSKRLFEPLAQKLPVSLRCQLVNFKLFVRGKPYRIKPHAEEPGKLLTVADKEQAIVLCRIDRRHYFAKGVNARLDLLARQYHLDRLADLRGGMFIDCGANIGELGFWARERQMSYVAFEPEELEARCCDLNNFGGGAGTIRKLLWKEEAEIEFFSAPVSGDSSIFASKKNLPVRKVPATTLDAAVDMASIDGPVILKLEAEGAEPEILQGAIESLKRIDWIAVDVGPERGLEQESTFVPVHDILIDAGFALRATHFKRVTALYERVA